MSVSSTTACLILNRADRLSTRQAGGQPENEELDSTVLPARSRFVLFKGYRRRQFVSTDDNDHARSLTRPVSA